MSVKIIEASHLLLEMHVIGGGCGESIVLHLPDDSWGVIDCCATRPRSGEDSSTANATLHFLRSHQVRRLKFLALTHPHADHYRGMKELLDKMPPEHFWPFPYTLNQFDICAGASARHVALSSEKSPNDASRSRRDGGELKEIFDTVHERVESRGDLRLSPMTERTELYNCEFICDDKKAKFTVTSITPDGNSAILYSKNLRDWLHSDDGDDRLLERTSPNEISAALKITFGETVILLGADATEHLWRTLIDNADVSLLAHIVKVSHHGSESSQLPDYASDQLPAFTLWQLFCGAGVKVARAIITPFASSRIPKMKVITTIKRYADRVLVTRPVDPIFSEPSTPTVTRLRRLPGILSAHSTRSSSLPEHRWSLTLNDTGGVVSESFVGQATAY